MKIKLKNVEYNERLSDETACFVADVYIDGHKAGTASNRGIGGANDYRPHELRDRIESYARTLPSLEIQGMTFQMSADLLIGELLEEHLENAQ